MGVMLLVEETILYLVACPSYIQRCWCIAHVGLIIVRSCLNKVFGSEARLGDHAKRFTMAGRMRNDPELVFWRNVLGKWSSNLQAVRAVSWRNVHLLPNFPGIARLLECEAHAFKEMTGDTKKDRLLEKKGRAAGRWAIALQSVMKTTYFRRLDQGNSAQKLMSRQLGALDKLSVVLSDGVARVSRMLQRLEDLTRFRIYTKTRVLICTVDSTARMLRAMEDGTLEAANAIGRSSHGDDGFSYRLSLDTAIIDEAACVLETAVPVVLSLGIKNLTLVGDPNQLQPFSQARENEAGQHHSRSLMERAIAADMPRHFLDTQYRMHPSLAEVRLLLQYVRGLLSSARFNDRLGEYVKVDNRANLLCLAPQFGERSLGSHHPDQFQFYPRLGRRCRETPWGYIFNNEYEPSVSVVFLPDPRILQQQPGTKPGNTAPFVYDLEEDQAEICFPPVVQIVSSTFYDNKLKTAEELHQIRRSPTPCKWIDVRGGEVKHKGRVRHCGTNAECTLLLWIQSQNSCREIWVLRSSDIFPKYLPPRLWHVLVSKVQRTRAKYFNMHRWVRPPLEDCV